MRTNYRRLRSAEQDGLAAFGKLVLERAQELAPVGTAETSDHPPGELRDSGKMEVLPDGSVWVRFTAPYAAKQHEALHFQHPNGGQAKYLEDALKELSHQMGPIVATAVGVQLKRGLFTGGAAGRRI